MGKECKLKEGDKLEFKSYKVDLLINNTGFLILIISRIDNESDL